mgnify:CR=1 FL=1
MKLYPVFYHDRTNFPKNWEKLQNTPEEDKAKVNPLLKPISITTCLLLDNEKKVVSMGVAIQNAIDGENRKVGNKKAEKRAIDAIRAKRNILPIWREYTTLLISSIKVDFPTFKGVFNPNEKDYNRFKKILEKKVLNEKEAIEVN